MSFKVKFWGVRGSRTVPGKNTLVYGGNTSCVEIRIQDHLIILDAGSGICELMEKLLPQEPPIYADIMISHLHWDHIVGLPFFKPLYHHRNIFCIHGANGQTYDFEKALKNIMRDPLSPVRFEDLNSYNHFVTHRPGEIFNLRDAWNALRSRNDPPDLKIVPPDVTVITHANQHPNGGIFYKLSYEAKSICYASDTECDPAKPDFIESFIQYVGGCDLLIMDTNYTRDEYEGRSGGSSKKGWGHSSWQDGVAVAKRANVKKLCLFHHNAERTDSEQAAIEEMAQAEFPATIAAKEGMELIV